MLRRLIGEDVDADTRSARALASIGADPSQIEQVLMNLSINARDAMPGGGTCGSDARTSPVDDAPRRRADRFRARTSAVGHRHGSGMDAETLADLRAVLHDEERDGHRPRPGDGVRDRRAGGRQIDVDTEIGRGTTFNVYLPQVTDADSAEALAVPDSVRTAARYLIRCSRAEDDQRLGTLIGK